MTRVGHGVFAACDFAPEERIGEVSGKLISDPDYGSDTCIDIGDALTIEPGPPFKYLNHSCEPNCELVTVDVDDGRRILAVETLRGIRRGEELTIDYSWPAEYAIPCLCQSPACRGWIVSPEEREWVGTAAIESGASS